MAGLGGLHIIQYDAPLGLETQLRRYQRPMLGYLAKPSLTLTLQHLLPLSVHLLWSPPVTSSIYATYIHWEIHLRWIVCHKNYIDVRFNKQWNSLTANHYTESVGMECANGLVFYSRVDINIIGASRWWKGQLLYVLMDDVNGFQKEYTPFTLSWWRWAFNSWGTKLPDFF